MGISSPAQGTNDVRDYPIHFIRGGARLHSAPFCEVIRQICLRHLPKAYHAAPE
jgi:hypothetical protein